MNVRFWCVLAVLAAGAGAETWPPTFAGITPAPAGSVGVGYENGPLYTIVDGTPPRVFQLDERSGSVIASFPLALPLGVRGITYADDASGNLFVSNYLNSYIYRLTSSGSLLSSFFFPYGPPYSIGFTAAFPYHGSGTGIFVACRNNNRIYRITTSGSLVASFAGPAAAVTGYDEWFCVDDNSPTLYWDYYGTWRELASLPALPCAVATGVGYTKGNAVTTYVLGNDGRLYRYAGVTAIAPASLGRVKAFFR